MSWQLVSVAGNDQLGTNERIQEKIDKIKRFAREAQVYCDGAELMRVGEFQVYLFNGHLEVKTSEQFVT